MPDAASRLEKHLIFLSAIWLQSRENFEQLPKKCTNLHNIFYCFATITMKPHFFSTSSVSVSFQKKREFFLGFKLVPHVKKNCLVFCQKSTTPTEIGLCSITLWWQSRNFRILLNRIIACNYLMASLAFVDCPVIQSRLEIARLKFSHLFVYIDFRLFRLQFLRGHDAARGKFVQ